MGQRRLNARNTVLLERFQQELSRSNRRKSWRMRANATRAAVIHNI